MAARSKARRRALDVLYQAELRGETPLQALARIIEEGQAPANPYTAVLVEGVAAAAGQIDDLLSRHSTGWTLERMPALDRNVLRLGVWELLHADDVPPPVAIAEAMALVQELSTDDSPTFVNGVLGAVRRDPAVTAVRG